MKNTCTKIEFTLISLICNLCKSSRLSAMKLALGTTLLSMACTENSATNALITTDDENTNNETDTASFVKKDTSSVDTVIQITTIDTTDSISKNTPITLLDSAILREDIIMCYAPPEPDYITTGPQLVYDDSLGVYVIQGDSLSFICDCSSINADSISYTVSDSSKTILASGSYPADSNAFTLFFDNTYQRNNTYTVEIMICIISGSADSTTGNYLKGIYDMEQTTFLLR